MHRLILIFFLILQCVCCLEAVANPEFVFVGDLSRTQFQESFQRAQKRLQNFYQSLRWKTEIDLSKLITQVEVYSTKEKFDLKIVGLSQGTMTAIPKTVVGLADKKILRVVSWSAYQKVHPEDSETDYEKLLTHEMAHQLHIAFLEGHEDQMGPIWFFEGFAVVAANQYEDSKLEDFEKTKSILLNSERGNYRSYGAIVREIRKSKTWPELIEMAQAPDFNSQIIQLFKKPTSGQ